MTAPFAAGKISMINNRYELSVNPDAAEILNIREVAFVFSSGGMAQIKLDELQDDLNEAYADAC